MTKFIKCISQGINQSNQKEKKKKEKPRRVFSCHLQIKTTKLKITAPWLLGFDLTHSPQLPLHFDKSLNLCRLCVCVCVCVCVCARTCSITPSGLTLCDPMDCSLPGSSVHGTFQAKILELQFPILGDLSDPGIKPTSPVSPALDSGFFTTSTTWEAQGISKVSLKQE